MNFEWSFVVKLLDVSTGAKREQDFIEQDTFKINMLVLHYLIFSEYKENTLQLAFSGEHLSSIVTLKDRFQIL